MATASATNDSSTCTSTSTHIEREFSGTLNTLQNLNDQRQNMKFCDFVLKTKDGGSFPVHKSVISAASPYFEAKFNNKNFSDSTSDSAELDDISTDVLNHIIEFMYTTKTKISTEYAKEMLDAALFLGLDSLVNGCTEILIETVNEENWYDLLNDYETYHLTKKLTNKCIEFILKNINIVVDSTQFVKISSDAIKRLIKFDRNLCHEESICLAAIKWISYDIEEREAFISHLIDGINFTKISNEFCMMHIFNSNNPLVNNVIFLQKMFEILKKNTKYLIDCNHKKSSILYPGNAYYQVIFDKNVTSHPFSFPTMTGSSYSFTTTTKTMFGNQSTQSSLFGNQSTQSSSVFGSVIGNKSAPSTTSSSLFGGTSTSSTTPLFYP